MGITINDTIVLDNGLSTNTSYGSFFKSNLTIEKEMQESEPSETDGSDITYSNTGNVILTAIGNIWSSKQYRDLNKSIIKIDTIQTVVPLSVLITSNVYELLYIEWKKSFSSVSDAL